MRDLATKSAALALPPSQKTLLLVLRDGKRNDRDHHEGRYGVEDTRKATGEAGSLRTAGLALAEQD